ncbi:formylmethanofuran dehydrogenase subunit C [Rhodoligotrophos defluvii]|uniref:formylmethanofuran dehydrogenase subunit C n=1 Tax=Rhodoligotrophos defluvii TaxID=2561934 RepID=UPI0010C95BF1|nr:formylmethanofuran dehydrogenase subunit C [Rhodoligotrophos defluvii]
MTLSFRLKSAPEQRVDLSGLTPEALAGKTVREIEHTVIGTTRIPLKVGDLFEVTGDDAQVIRFLGGSNRFDHVGHGMTGGSLIIEGDVGQQAGRLMSGGHLIIEGNAGRLAGSGMRGGRIDIHGDAGDFAGGPLPGEMAGMRGGLLRIAGNAGERAGDRMRRGVIVVGDHAGAYAGSRMIAGTLIVGGKAGPLPGYLMRRGSIILGQAPEQLSPSFVGSGQADDVFLKVLLRDLAQKGIEPDLWPAARQWGRFVGDMAVLGRGELIWCVKSG